MSLRDLPSVDALAATVDAPHATAVAAARRVIDARREELRAGATDDVDLSARARAAARPSLRRVLNATGVVLHTGLGRAVLSEAAQAAVAEAASGYTNLELDLDSGERGSRHDHVAPALRALTGAEAALAVNNGAGAVLLAAAALAQGREIVVSRGQLVEIGGGFRIPDVVEQAGATLVEVGTTNRTRLADYEAAIGERTGAILRVHQANFRQTGFVEDVGVAALATLGVPVIDDLGSGALTPIGDEPTVPASVAAGAALVTFSGDKLLGGPQAGLLVGRADAIAAAREHPLARALRIDKLSLAALAATLLDPVVRIRGDSPNSHVERLADGIGVVVESSGRMGGGTLPTTELPGRVVAVDTDDPVGLAAALRRGDPPLIGRIESGRLLLDPRTLSEAEVEVARQLVLDRLGCARPDS